MAHYCPECRHVFEMRKAICPQCGYCGVDDDRPDQFYLDQGYTRFSLPSRQSAPASASTPTAGKNTTEVKIDDADLIAQLRAGIGSYQDKPETDSTESPRTATPANPPQNGSNDDFFGSYAGTQGAAPNPPRTTPPASTSSRPSSNNDDFFGGYQNTPPRRPEAPQNTGTGTRPASTNNPVPQRTGHGNYRVPGARGNSLRRFFSGLGNFFSAIPWRAVFYIALAVIIIVVVYSIWQMRAAIVSSIISFLVSLIPAALLIAVIVWLIRGLFR